MTHLPLDQDRLKRLALLYGMVLDREIRADGTKVRPAIAERLSLHTPEEIAKALSVTALKGLELAKDAFLPTPKFYFTQADGFATHSFWIDLLTIADLDIAIQGGNVMHSAGPVLDLIRTRTATAYHLLYWFPDPPNKVQGLIHVPELLWKQLVAVWRAASHLPTNESLGAPIVRAAMDLVKEIPNIPSTLIVFGDARVTKNALIARLFCVLTTILPILSHPDQQNLISVLHQLSCVVTIEDVLLLLSRECPADCFESIVVGLQEFITMGLIGGERESGEKPLDDACYLLRLFNTANYMPPHASRGKIEYRKFYNQTVMEFSPQQMQRDFLLKLETDQAKQLGPNEGGRPSAPRIRFAFCHYPFIISEAFKAVFLQLEAQVEYNGAMRNAVFASLFQGAAGVQNYLCILQIHRQQLIQSTLNQLQSKGQHLRKPLKIEFVGEPGVDEGGLKKEFFQLVTRTLFDPNFYMFTPIEETRALWFVPTVKNKENRREFFLIGQLLGLAVYNNVIIDASFPITVFRKLLGIPIHFEDLEEVDPALAHGMKDLLSFQETPDCTVEDTFCRTFVYEHDVFGRLVEVPLVEGGESMTLTAENRQQFVDAICQYVLEKSIAANFDEFRQGFFSVCTRDLIKQLRPEELELLVCGNPNLDFKELENSTVYDGYRADESTIKMFWKILHNFAPDQKRAFLKFATGSDRVPVGGLKDLQFKVGRNGDDSDMLPTAHTCFNHFLLPKYRTEEKMKQKILLAIQNCTGFGLR